MFQTVRMKRLRVITLENYRQPLIRSLHKLGVVQVGDYEGTRVHPNEVDEGLVNLHITDPDLKVLTTQVMRINKILDVFEEVSPLVGESFFKKIFRPTPPEKVPVEELDREVLVEETEKALVSAESEVEGPAERLSLIEREINESNAQKISLEDIRPLDVPLEYVGAAPLLTSWVGLLAREDSEEIESLLEKETDGLFYLGKSELIDDQKYAVVVVCLSKDSERVNPLIRRAGFDRVEVSGLSGTPEDALAKIGDRLQELDKEKVAISEQIARLSVKWRGPLSVLREQLNIERDRSDVQSRFAATDMAIAIEGWIPDRSIEMLARTVEEATDGYSVVRLTEPDVDPKSVPVLLDNPGIFRHFEFLTKLYSSPKYDEIDPTMLLMPSFCIFFGIMVTDAAYGFVTLLVGSLLAVGGGKYNRTIRDLGIILATAGFATIIIGALTGGWLGDFAINYMGIESLRSVMLLDQLTQVQLFLYLVLAVGIVHLIIGILTGIMEDVKHGSLKDAVFEKAWPLLALPGIALIYMGSIFSGGLLAIAALAMLVVGHKSMFFFEITGFLGDVLSYARLMALGLCTFGIAMTVNVLAEMVSSVAVVGLVAAPVVFVFGHILNWIIQALGGFVHSMRLHYVEFFSKFYEGGGTDFRPFYVERSLTEEI
jgi:V/A-type H+-transporting ATPase subunit I